jgi:hypothetical protein
MKEEINLRIHLLPVCGSWGHEHGGGIMLQFKSPYSRISLR